MEKHLRGLSQQMTAGAVGISVCVSQGIDRGENLLLFGPTGFGKAHLAAGICRSLIALVSSAHFFSGTTLLQHPQQAKAHYAMAKSLTKLDSYALGSLWATGG